MIPQSPKAVGLENHQLYIFSVKKHTHSVFFTFCIGRFFFTFYVNFFFTFYVNVFFTFSSRFLYVFFTFSLRFRSQSGPGAQGCQDCQFLVKILHRKRWSAENAFLGASRGVRFLDVLGTFSLRFPPARLNVFSTFSVRASEQMQNQKKTLIMFF